MAIKTSKERFDPTQELTSADLDEHRDDTPDSTREQDSPASRQQQLVEQAALGSAIAREQIASAHAAQLDLNRLESAKARARYNSQGAAARSRTMPTGDASPALQHMLQQRQVQRQAINRVASTPAAPASAATPAFTPASSPAARPYQRQNPIEATSMRERFEQRLAQQEQQIRQQEQERMRNMRSSRISVAPSGHKPGSHHAPGLRPGIVDAPASSAASRSQATRPAAGIAAAGARSNVRIDLSAVGPGTRSIPFSPEQMAVIADPSPILVVNAFAGTGKTATAVGFTQARPHARTLYIAFAKPMQLEAQERFPGHVSCRTTHSLAYQAIGHRYHDQLVRDWRTMTVADNLNISDYRLAAMAKGILQQFFQSADPAIDRRLHCEKVLLEFTDATEVDLMQAQLHAQTLWSRMQNPTSGVAMPHDAYLKMWGLSKPRLPYDVIIFDEAQDANPVTSDIIAQQHGSTRLYIGDRHQSIFAFRGAVNAMENFEGMGDVSQHHLSHTWRFGPRTADIANTILAHLKNEIVPIIGRGKDAPMQGQQRMTLLARTNAQLFKEAVANNGAGVHWVGGIGKYQFSKILDAYFVYSRKSSQVRDPFMRRFSSFSQMVDMADASHDHELGVLCSVVEEYRNETPGLIELIAGNAIKHEQDADYIVATAHGSKGLDWDYVRLAEDFEFLKETEDNLAADANATIDEQEANLLYVAATRAKKEVFLNEETTQWMQDLPRHLEDRERARQIRDENMRQAGITPSPTHSR